MRFAFFALLLLTGLAGQAVQAEQIVPERRLEAMTDIDLPGGDISTQFGLSKYDCTRACLANSACTALSYDADTASCVLKSGEPDSESQVGMWSARVRDTDPEVLAQAAARQRDLTFLFAADLEAARSEAEGLALTFFPPGEVPPPDALREATAAAAAADDAPLHVSLAKALVMQTDAPGDWAGLARLYAGYGEWDGSIHAAANGYLRAGGPGERHELLVLMAQALEKVERGRDAVLALNLAQGIESRAETATYLARLAGIYGFRVLETRVENDLARPRLCAVFSEELAKAGVTYADFVRLDQPGLSVTASGQEICIEGASHGARLTATLRQGLPAADGQVLRTSVEITQYIPDRSPSVRFPGRGYILPRGADPALPVETVNLGDLDLTLYRVTDRNLLRSFQDGYFGTPMSEWQEPTFAATIGTEVWHGSAQVTMELNRDITTRLPLRDALAGQPAGVYALRAALPSDQNDGTAAAWQWFAVSDLGLTSLSGTEGLTVVVRSLATAGAKPDVQVDLLSVANEVLASTRTDGDGVARFDAGVTRGKGAAQPALLVARDGPSDLAFLSLTDPEFDLSDRGVEGRAAAPPVDLWLTTDRGAYRAGETVHVTALARDPAVTAISGLPLTWILTRPDGVEQSRGVQADTLGGYVFDLPISANAARGTWRLDLKAEAEGPTLASATFLVEDFLPERLDFTASLPDRVLLGDRPDIRLSARYLYGAPAADLAIEGETTLQAAAGLPSFPGYLFGREDEPFSPVTESLPPARTDTAGQAVVPIALPAVADPMRPLEARVTLRVAEGSGRPVERRATRLLTPSAPMIGIKPLFDGVVPENGAARFALIGLGDGGKPIPMRLHWEVTRIVQEYQWYQSYGDWMWEPVTTRQRIAEGEAESAQAGTEIAVPVEWGEYELSVTRLDGAPVGSSVTFSAGWYAAADLSATPDMLEMSLDKPAYAPGERAMLRLVPKAAGTALVSVLSDHVVALKAVSVTEGENLIPLEVTEDWGAGAYVTVSALRPMDVAAGHNPSRALGIAHAGISPGKRALEAAIEVTPEANPRQPLPVAVKVEGLAAGEQAYVTLTAVDQGILNLTGFAPPDPQGWYFGQRKLGVAIRDIYGRLIDGLNGATGTVRSGGDAGANARLQADPPTEDLLAFFSGPIPVGPDGVARTEFPLPAFNGQVKLMAVAWSAGGVGQAAADVLVRDPVVVTASLPRFLSPGDESRLLLELTHATGPAGPMGLTVAADGLGLGVVPASVTLAAGQTTRLTVPVTALDPGLHDLTVTLTTPDGKALTKVLNLPVAAKDPPLMRISRFDLEPGQSFTFDAAVFDGLAPGATATLAAGPVAELNVPGLLAGLDQYPYGCAEQLSSRLLPLLYFADVAAALHLSEGENLDARIDTAVQDILAHQGAEGGFGLWGPGSGDLWLDAFVTDVLSRARAQGHRVPERALARALSNLRNQVNYAADFDRGGEGLAYALMVLAREGAAAIGDLRYYADVKAGDFATPAAMAQLGMALSLYGDQPRADALFARADSAIRIALDQPARQDWRPDYGSPLRDAAIVLALSAQAGSQAVDRAALAARMAAGGDLSTQEAAWTLVAAHALLQGAGGTALTLNGTPVTGPLVHLADAASLQPMAVANAGQATTSLTVTTFGIPTEPAPAGGNGYAIARRYVTLAGEPVDPARVAVGTRLVAVLEIQPFAAGAARLMVNDPLPAGFEIDNPSLISVGTIPALDALGTEANVSHAEFRQDRFLAALDRQDATPFRLAYVLRAISPGTFHHPAPSVEDMYRPEFRAQGAAGTVVITP